MLVASSPKDSATARAAFIRSQQQHLSVTAAAASRKRKHTASGDEFYATIARIAGRVKELNADIDAAADRVKEVERENKRLREERTCKICLDATAAMLFDPCGHLSTCARWVIN